MLLCIKGVGETSSERKKLSGNMSVRRGIARAGGV